MATIEDFILRFKTVGTDGIKAAQSGIQGLKDDVAGLTQVGGPLGNTLNGIIGKLGPIGLAAGAAGAAFAALGMKAINIADEIQDMADATGIGAGQLMNLKQSLIEAGGKADSFVGITSKLSVGIGQAMDGNEKFQKSFRDLGVYITDSNGKIRDSGDILQDVVGKLAGIEDPAVRSAKAVELLGKEASKIDWSKVSAGRDAIKDEQIAALAAYRGEIDKLANSIETKLVTAFGELATAVNKGGLVEGLAVAIEQMGTLVSYIPGLGKMADLVNKARMERLSANTGGGRGGQGGPTAEELKKYQDSQNPAKAAGGYGGPSEQAIKAAADSRQRIAQSEAETRKQLELSTANQVGAIEINAKYEAVKAKAEIDNKERLSAAQKTAEYVAKEKEIFAKRDNDIAKVRRELNVRIAAEEMAQAEQNAREMAAYYQQVDQARLQAFDQTESIRLAREELARRITLEEKIITLSDREAKNAIELLGLEEERLKAIRAIAAIQNLPYEDRVKKEKEINDEYTKGKQLILDRQNIEFDATRNFAKGWEKALADYTENSQNSFQNAGKLFGKITGNMEDAIVDFAKTGKFEFKGFMASILEDLLRSQVRNLIASLFGLKSSGGTGSGGLFGGSIIPGFLAKGGSAQAGKPYVVGEKGPELFIPGASGSVVPNNMLGGGGMTNVVYNINAVDTTSFKQLLARDPGFIYAVTEQGRKTVPSTRR